MVLLPVVNEGWSINVRKPPWSCRICIIFYSLTEVFHHIAMVRIRGTDWMRQRRGGAFEGKYTEGETSRSVPEVKFKKEITSKPV